MRYSKRGVGIVLVIGLCLMLSAILVVQYAEALPEALFLVLVGWILVPVLIAKLYHRFIGKKD